MKPLAALPLALRPSFEAHETVEGAELHHCDIACGPNTRANDIYDAENALWRAGFDTVAVGCIIYVRLPLPVKPAQTKPKLSLIESGVELGFSPLGRGLEDE